jgi:hypothetical protein
VICTVSQITGTWAIKARRRWAGHVTIVRERRRPYRVSLWTSKVKDNLEDLGVDARIILKFIFKK